jgi:hypothetical protein
MLKWMYFSFMVLTSLLAVIINSHNNKPDLTLVLAQAATNNNNNNNTLQSTLSSQPSITHGVKITSPTKGQQVPIGKDITISGTSLANPNSNCQITVIVNHVKPYQPAAAAGPEDLTTTQNGTLYSILNIPLFIKDKIKLQPNIIAIALILVDYHLIV